MRLLVFCAWIVALCVGTTTGRAKADEENAAVDSGSGVDVRWSPSVEISGFGDFVASYHGGGVGSSFQIGQAEIDLVADLGSRVGAEMAITYGNDSFSLGVFVVGATIYQSADGTGGLLGLNAVTISGGQFDVPFGIDWKVYPSFDRKLISVPLVVEYTHGGWNDRGVAGRLNARWGNVAAFAVSDLAFESTAPDGSELASDGDYAVGARVGLKPMRLMELGGSYARSGGNAGALDQELVGADLQYAIGPFAFKGEYIAHTIRSYFGSDFRTNGFYIQTLYHGQRYYLVARHDQFDAAALRGGTSRRTSAGAGWIVTEKCELRIEYQRSETFMRDCAFTQVAIAF